MRKKPVLIVMAAGMGSRYGGLKQIAPVDDNGNIMMDYAIYDAKRVGFETVVCVIKPGMEREFRDAVGDRIASAVDLRIAFQHMDALPAGFSVPDGRIKPWGTSHAVLSAKELVDGPFSVINADDFYGADAYRVIYDFLVEESDASNHALVGYKLENTLTEHGHVARGVCEVDNGKLTGIAEHLRIEKRGGGAESIFDDGSSVFLPGDTIVSMNLWGYGHGIMDEFEAQFTDFLRDEVPVNPLKSEYLLPRTSNTMLIEKKAEFSVLPTSAKWCGVTYAQDMPAVQLALKAMRDEGKYPGL